MKHARHLLILVFLFAAWSVQGQTPATAADYVKSGFALEEKGDLDGAIADYTKAIEIDPRYARAYDNRGSARAKKGDPDGAIADYSKAIELDPRYPLAYIGRGLARSDKGDLDGAISDYSKAIEIDPRIMLPTTVLPGCWQLPPGKRFAMGRRPSSMRARHPN